MNKVRTELQGGFPYTLDDVRFTNNEIILGLSNIIKSVADKCILWGCDYSQSGTIASVTEGYVYFDNEIFYCPPQSVDLGIDIQDDIVLQLKEHDSTSPNASRLFADGNHHNVWAVREVELIDIHHATNFVCLKERGLCSYELEKFINIIRKTSDHANEADELNSGDWQTPTINSGFSGSNLAYRFLSKNIVELRGEIFTDGSNIVIFTLPVNYRPNIKVGCSIAQSGTLPVKTCSVVFNPNGDVEIIGNAGYGYIDFSFTID